MPSPAKSVAISGRKIISDPLLALSPIAAWRATNVSVSGGNTNSWLPLVGSTSLASVGTAQLAPVSDSDLNNQMTVPFSNTGSYTGTLSAAPGLNQTLFVVGKVLVNSPTNAGNILAVSNGGIANSGTMVFSYLETFYARANVVEGGDASVLKSLPLPFVMLGTFTTASRTIRVNSTTKQTTTGTAGSYSFTTVGLGGSGGGAGVNLKGSIAEAAIFDRVLSDAEANSLVASRAGVFGITLT